MSKPKEVEGFSDAPAGETMDLKELLKNQFRQATAAQNPSLALAAETSTVPNQTAPADTVPAAAAPVPGPAPAAAPAESSTVPNRTAPHAAAPSRTKKPKPLPWADANPAIPVGFNFRMNQVIHAKSVALCDVMPGRMSLQKLYMQAIEEKIDRLVKEYFPEGEGA